MVYLLHGILKPSRKIKKADTKKKQVNNNSEPVGSSSNKTTLYGIQDAIDSMLKTRTNVSATVPQKKKEQPHIICIGDSIYSLNQFIVKMEDTEYQATSFLHAIEITLKVFNLFGFHYPVESYNVWLFFQKFFLDVHFKEWDHINNDITSLIEKLICYEKELSDEEDSVEE